jgi:hypothetical protein
VHVPPPPSGQVRALNVPLPVALQLTVPVGVERVPTSVSETVAVQGMATPALKGAVQVTEVPVLRVPTLSAGLLPLPAAWLSDGL